MQYIISKDTRIFIYGISGNDLQMADKNKKSAR